MRGLCLLIFATLALLTLFSPFVFAGKAAQLTTMLPQIDREFRSSDQNIDATTLLNFAAPKLSKPHRYALANASVEQIIGAARECKSCKMNKGVVENLIRIHLLLRACHDLCLDLPIDELIAKQFRALSPDYLLRMFPATDSTKLRPGEFSFTEYLMAKKAMMSALNNDLYNFKMAGTYFAEGMHRNHLSTFRLFSRGHENRNYIVAAGIDQALDLLQNLRFSEYEVSILEKNPDFKNLPPAFFDYLRNFKFKGSVRAVETGTIVFKDEPILEISGNPVEVSIVETLLVHWVNKMSLFTTKAVRVSENAGGRFLSEGASRRSTDPFASALAAILAGFPGTSNVEVSALTGARAMGTQAHQYLGHFHPDEVVAHAIYRKYFPDTTLLVDTYDILSGVRAALIASGSNFKGIRLDSTVPGVHKDPTEAKRLTVLMVQELLQALGYDHGTYTITYSDGLTEKSLKYLTDRKAPFQIALVGTEIAAASDVSHLNTVYKVVEILNTSTGKITYPIKLATGKVLRPGRSQLWREFDNKGFIKRDVLARMDESLDWQGAGSNWKSLLSTKMLDGIKTQAREAVKIQSDRIQANLATLPAKYRQLEPLPEDEKFKLDTSPGVLTLQNSAREKALGKSQLKIGFVFMSGDPFHDEHEEMIRRARLAFQLDRVYVVLTGETRVHKEGKPLFSNTQRLQMGLRRFPAEKMNEHGVVFWTGELEGRTQRTIDTLDDIKARVEDVRASKLYMIAGTDVFKSLPSWKQPDRLLNEFNWVVMQRKDHVLRPNQLTDPLFSKFKLLDDHAVMDGPHGNRIAFYDPRLKASSATASRERIARVENVFHEVDVQMTFWEGMHGTPTGPLGVTNSKNLTENIILLKWMAKNTASIKSTASADEHFEIETRRPDINSEFHPSPDGSFPGFPPHGMSKVWGSIGDGRIPEVQFFDPAHTLEIKHHQPKGNGLELVPFNVDANIDRILDPKYEVFIRKNGNESYSLWKNPYAAKVYELIKPKTIYVFGVATDFCVAAFVLEAVKKYDVVVVTDAIAGVFPASTAQQLAAMKAAGARMMTTDEVIATFKYNRSEISKLAQREVKEVVKRVKQERSMCRSMFGG